MGYSENLQKLCALRSMDQATLAGKVGLSKSSISRILSGVQEPKLQVAYDLAKALGVTLDYLVKESSDLGPSQHLVMVTDEELMILKIARRLGSEGAIDRLLNVESSASHVVVTNPPSSSLYAGRGRSDFASGNLADS